MHFSIPDTQDFSNPQTGASYTGFNIHINGTFHCCLRYKQLHSLNEQLRRSLPTLTLPAFPSKKLLPLTPHQVEQRRIALERYIQLLGQDPVFSKSELLRQFLLSAQQESTFTESRETTVDVYLMNGFRIEVNCYTTECSSKVLAKACHNIDVRPEYSYYFALYLMRKERDGGVTLVRKLMDFEAPYISQRLQEDCKIVIRKNFWDPRHDAKLMYDSVALNVLYILTLSDVERGWILTTAELRDQLHKLQLAGNKREYLEVAKTLPAYGCLKFSNATVTYPPARSGELAESNSAVLPPPSSPTSTVVQQQPASIYIGNKELCVRIGGPTQANSKLPSQLHPAAAEMRFKVTLMRCWRVTTNYTAANGSVSGGHNGSSGSLSPAEPINSTAANSPVHTSMELSFEYLMAKKQLQWVTIVSEQAMLMSVCLQSMVEELLSRKEVGVQQQQPQSLHQQQQLPGEPRPMNGGGRADAAPLMSYVRRDGRMRRMSDSSSTDTISSLATDPGADNSLQLSAATGDSAPVRRKLREKISTTVLFLNGKGSVHNEAFEGIGDDDL